jgi:hypothetical protein
LKKGDSVLSLECPTAVKATTERDFNGRLIAFELPLEFEPPLRATPEHRFLVYRARGVLLSQIGWRNAKDIKIGDFLIIPTQFIKRMALTFAEEFKQRRRVWIGGGYGLLVPVLGAERVKHKGPVFHVETAHGSLLCPVVAHV